MIIILESKTINIPNFLSGSNYFGFNINFNNRTYNNIYLISHRE